MLNENQITEMKKILKEDTIKSYISKDDKKLKDLLTDGIIAKYDLDESYQILKSGEKIKNINNKDSLVLTSSHTLCLLTYESNRYEYEYIELDKSHIVSENRFNVKYDLSKYEDTKDLKSLVKEFDTLEPKVNKLRSRLKYFFEDEISNVSSNSNENEVKRRNILDVIKNYQERPKNDTKKLSNTNDRGMSYGR